MRSSSTLATELRGGIEAALQGASTAVGPLLLFLGLFGPLALAPGLWAALLTATLIPLTGLLFKGHPALIGGPRTASLATYAGLVLQLSLAGSTDAGRTGHTVLTLPQLTQGLAVGSVMFAVASLLILLAGLFRLGHVFKMIPTPVASGISNGTALLLITLAASQLTHGSVAAPLTAAVMVAAVLWWPRLQRKLSALALMPGVVVAMLLGVGLAICLEPAPAALTPSASPMNWRWISVLLWPQVQQHETLRWLLMSLPGAITLALVMMLETFTAASQMQTRFGVRVDPNRELLTLGGANLLGAALGGVPCTASPLRSVSSWQAGGRGLRANLVCLGLTGILLLSLSPWLMTLPAGLAAGLLLLQTISMVELPFLRRLVQLLRPGARRLPGGQDMGFWIVLAISLIGFLGNLIWASFLGVGLSCMLVLRRVSVNLTAQWTTLARHRSRRVRSAGEFETLSRLSQRVAVLQLTGHLFFGNSVRLMQLADELPDDAVAVVIDVARVHDVDPSGLDALAWLIRVMRERGLTLMVSGLRQTDSNDLREALMAVEGLDQRIDLDRALEAAEDLVLLDATVQATPLLHTALPNNQLLQELDDDEITEVLLLGDRRALHRGEPLFFRDAAADGVWLLESGHVSVLAGESADSTRIATFGPGQFVGEMSLIDGKSRSATALADTELSALLLDRQAIAVLMQRQPATALKIMGNIARELSLRVRNSTALLAQQEAGFDLPSEGAKAPSSATKA